MDPSQIELRSFQRTALARAREGNLLFTGPTGIGKTLCASAILQEADFTGGKIAWVLTNTRSLADQHYTHLKNSLPWTVKLCVGRELDLWSREEWQAALAGHQVIVATAQVLLNLLEKGANYLTLEQINHLILDECHAAVKSHPYNKILAKYSGAPVHERPRILAMTATPTPQSMKNLQMPLYNVPEHEAKPYAAIGALTLRLYWDGDYRPVPGPIQDLLEEIKILSEDFSGGDLYVEVPDLAPVTCTSESLGIWFGIRHLAILLSHVVNAATRLADHDDCGSTTNGTIDYLRLLCNIFMGKLDRLATHHTPTNSNWLVSNQVHTLLEVLKGRTGGEERSMMVFVQTRMTCRCLYDYLNLLPEWNGRCGMVVGMASESGAPLYGVPSCAKALQAFRSGDIELIITTDVSAEGIDIPSCSLVVAFDRIPTPQAFTQMRGRARSSSGLGFVVMVPNEEERSRVLGLEAKAKGFGNPGEGDGFLMRRSDLLLSKQYPEYSYHIVSTGATIDLDNSLILLNSFCQCSSDCQSYGLVPEFIISEETLDITPTLTNPRFTCQLILPSPLGLEPIDTPEAFPRKTIAQAVAAYLACVRFHATGLIDDDLNPVRQEEEVLASFPSFRPEVADLSDNITIPAPTHRQLGLEAILPLASQSLAADGRPHTLLLHRASGATRLALVTRSALPHTDLARSLVTEDAVPLVVSREDLKKLVCFHSFVVHVAMYGWQAMVETQPSFLKEPGAALDEFQDKGYIVVPLSANGAMVDWDVVNRVSAPGGTVLTQGTMWPLPMDQEQDPSDLLVLSHTRDNQRSRLYEVVGLSDITLGNYMEATGDDEKVSKVARLESSQSEEGAMDTETQGSREGDGGNKRPRLVPWYSRRTWVEEGDLQQPLLLARRHVYGARLFPQKQPRQTQRKVVLLAPQFCSLLSIPRGVMQDCQKLIPQLCDLEASLKHVALLEYMGLPVTDKRLFKRAITKPDYERLEVLGDSYLKLSMGQYVCQVEPILKKEGLLHSFRSNLVCNKRLLQCAMERDLAPYIEFPPALISEPFRHWAPSFHASFKPARIVNFKTVSDVVEAILGAFLLDGGPQAANRFLQWLGLPSPCSCDSDSMIQKGPSERWPVVWTYCKCWHPGSRLYESMSPLSSKRGGCRIPGELQFLCEKFEDGVLHYKFRDRALLVQALTHPSFNTFLFRARDGEREKIGDYQRLEFLGDAVLDLLVLITLHHQHPDWGPLHLTGKQHELVSNEVMAAWGASKLEVHKYMRHDSLGLAEAFKALIPRGMDEGRDTALATTTTNGNGVGYPKALADVVEALVAAVFVDCGGDMERLAGLFLPLVMAEADLEGGDEDEVGLNQDEGDGGDDQDEEAIIARLTGVFPSLPFVLHLLDQGIVGRVVDDGDWEMT